MSTLPVLQCSISTITFIILHNKHINSSNSDIFNILTTETVLQPALIWSTYVYIQRTRHMKMKDVYVCPS